MVKKYTVADPLKAINYENYYSTWQLKKILYIILKHDVPMQFTKCVMTVRLNFFSISLFFIFLRYGGKYGCGDLE